MFLEHFTPGGLHALISPQRASSLGFCAHVLAQRLGTEGRVLWCTSQAEPHVHGLSYFGLLPHQILFAQPQEQKDMLWALEEGAQTPALAAVVAEDITPSPIAARRLQLAAQKNKSTLVFLLKPKQEAQISHFFLSKWFITPLISNAAPGRLSDNAVGAPRLEVELLRHRNGSAPRKWVLEWNGDSFLPGSQMPAKIYAR